jgi:prephenate dehydrogenase
MKESGFSLADSTVVIVGLGLMGGSLALSLKGKCAHLMGLDTDQATLELARRRKMVDVADDDPAGVLPGADLLILAVPVPAILDWLRDIPMYIRHPCIILDVGSTKRAIVERMESLPPDWDPIGGHPICGKETLGIEHADPALFQDQPFILSPLERTTQRARSAVGQILSILEARSIELDAESHDRILALTSHLPYLLSAALARSTPSDYAPLIGPGFRSASRLAGTPSGMMLGVLKSNRDNILDSILRLHNSLTEIETALQKDDCLELENMLIQARQAYYSLAMTPITGDEGTG